MQLAGGRLKGLGPCHLGSSTWTALAALDSWAVTQQVSFNKANFAKTAAADKLPPAKLALAPVSCVTLAGAVAGGCSGKKHAHGTCVWGAGGGGPPPLGVFALSAVSRAQQVSCHQKRALEGILSGKAFFYC